MSKEWRRFFKYAAAVSGIATMVFLFSLSLREGESEEIARLTPETKITQESIEKLPVQGHVATSDVRYLSNMTIALEPGDTLIEALENTGIPFGEAFAASNSLLDVYDPRDLKASQKLSVSVWLDDDQPKTRHLDRLTFVPKIDQMVILEHNKAERFEARIETIEHNIRLAQAKGTILDNLFNSATEAGVPVPVLMAASRVLGQAVDFQRDITQGDKFVFAYEIYDDQYTGGTHTGNLVYVSLNTSDNLVEFYRHETADGFVSYFDDAGRSNVSGLMRTPVSKGRLSSSYGKREHPVLGYTRMHKGLDFAATLGTPVLSAGDGVIVQRGRNGSFGKYIRIRHSNGFSTAYAHLDQYTDTLEPGDRVRRGEVIGYVGETGLTTGPNLHFEVLNGGRQVNPAQVVAPPLRKLEGEALSQFRRDIAELKMTLGIPMRTIGARSRPDVRVLFGDEG